MSIQVKVNLLDYILVFKV